MIGDYDTVKASIDRQLSELLIMLILCCVVAVAMIFIGFRIMRRRHRMVIVERIQEQTQDQERVVTTEWNGRIYYISVYSEKGMWVTPFPMKSGNGCIVRKTIRDVERALKSFVKNPEYRSMIDELIAQGKIQSEEVAVCRCD
jgi:hypothetical protein